MYFVLPLFYNLNLIEALTFFSFSYADDEEPTASPSRQVERPQVKEKVEAFQLSHTM